MFGKNKFKVSEEAKKELASYCEKHNTTDLKALLMSEEHGDEGMKIMYKHIPVIARSLFSEEKFMGFVKGNKEFIFSNIPDINTLAKDANKNKK